MEIRFVPIDLHRIADLRCEALVLGISPEERPPRRTAGLVDWRLCGRISRLIVDGRFKAGLGEKLLLPPRPRLACEKLFLFGTGPSAELDEPLLRSILSGVMSTLGGAHIRNAAVALPRTAPVALESAVEILIDEALRGDALDELALVEDPEQQRHLAPAIERARRRSRAAGD